jgi:hypothetical protein
MDSKVVDAVSYLDQMLVSYVDNGLECPTYVVARSFLKSRFDLSEDGVALAMCCFTWSPLYQFAGKVGAFTLRPVIPND